MKLFSAVFVIFIFGIANAQKIKFNYPNEDVAKIIEAYSKTTGQIFITDPGVRGKVSLHNSEELSYEEAFNQLSTALAIHGYAISKQENTMVVQPARATQRSLIDVSTELPALKPERMTTWIVTIRNGTADDILKQFRNITSRDGDITSYTGTNQLVITDWASNLHRISSVLKQIDKPVEPSLAKYVERAQKKNEEFRKRQEANKADEKPGFHLKKKEKIEDTKGF